MTAPLRVPCTYQGGKQRVASAIAKVLIETARSESSRFYDLCCGSGAISLELVNRGIAPERITMLDASSWGTFWNAIGSGKFRMDVFEGQLSRIPADRRNVKEYMKELSSRGPGDAEAEIYPILQACSFGGKQLWWDGTTWRNAYFRSFWQPTETSVRRSSANPMQPSPEELRRRVQELERRMIGVDALREDVNTILDENLPDDSVVYVDPPYIATTNYGFNFDVLGFAQMLGDRTRAAVYVSEGRALGSDALELQVGGANGGISGNRVNKHKEWLTRIQ